MASDHPVDYDGIASEYDRRYERNRWSGVEATITRFVEGCGDAAAGEVGCGTGHWLAVIDPLVRQTVGIDISWAMLARARTAAPAAGLARASAESLPWASGSLSRVLCINALHHVADRRGFLRECRRVLRPGGALLVISLDPHTGEDSWWIYDYFPSALALDRRRYVSMADLREWLTEEGFRDVSTTVAQHLPASIPFEKARERGFLDRRSTSQLMVIGDEELASGMARIEAERPILTADLRLFATQAWVGGHGGT